LNHSDLASLMQVSRWCCVFAISMSGALQLDDESEAEEVLEPDLPEMEIATPTNSGTDLDSDTTISTTENEAIGVQAADPNQIASIVDPAIIEEARRRCEHDPNKEELVQLLFTKLREALGKETRQHKIKQIKNMLSNSRESFHNACRMKNEDIATLIFELEEQIAHGDVIDSEDT
jgi:hypothetical protein